MAAEELRDILRQVQQGQLALEAAERALQDLWRTDLGFARIDHHREARKGFPEVIYCAGKQLADIREIFSRLARRGRNVLATRADADIYQAVAADWPDARFHARCRAITLDQEHRAPDPHVPILVVCAGTSDIPVAEEAAVTARIMGHHVEEIYDVGVAGIHRLLEHQDRLRAAAVVVVVAGMEGALASVVGGLVSAPVIAVPTSIGYGANFAGLAALLGMLNSCSSGVAVVNIDNGFGAGYTAGLIVGRILSAKNRTGF
ncbi:nickel pincer cofactor biosynthesis protein LarB [bacterium]|nr:nickel pincer cofactor biosynthesis protein LarB [bacterium]